VAVVSEAVAALAAPDVAIEPEPEEPSAEVVVAPGGPLVAAVTAARVQAAEARMVREEVPAPPGRPPWWRRVGFALVVLGLVAAIPVLGLVGYRVVTNSTDGKLRSNVTSPDDPGYQELVTPTPTALIMQEDAEGVPVALTVLSLSSPSGGGSVIFVPLNTAVRKPAYGVDRISRAYDVMADDRPVDGRKQVAFQVASTLNVGLDETIELDDRRWAQLVQPLGSLKIVNPDPVTIDGVDLPTGAVELTPEQVGPYLAARSADEGELNQLNRQALVWTAWLDAVGKAGDLTLPGEQDAGISRFARSLAKGTVAYEVLPGAPATDGSGTFVVDDDALTDLIVDAVPAPTPAYPGSRATVRVLNGVGPDPIPDEVLRRIVHVQGAITYIGNGPAFGRDASLIVYTDPAEKGHAELLKAALDGKPEVKLDRTADDSVALTLILGHDVLDDLATDGGN
jgi:hypothetical protein